MTQRWTLTFTASLGLCTAADTGPIRPETCFQADRDVTCPLAPGATSLALALWPRQPGFPTNCRSGLRRCT